MENNEVKKGSKRPYVIAIALALALVITITATSYAYFVGTVNNTTTPTTTDVTTTSLGIEFTDGAQVTLENAIPGSYVVKTFKVENTGAGDTTYDVYMSDLINDFADKIDLVYTLTSNDGGYNVSTQTQVPGTSSKIVSNQLIRAGEEHNYTLRVDFKETNDNQDDNKGKTFSTIIRINEVQESKFSLRGNANEILGQFSEYNLTTNVIDKGETDTFAYDGTTDNNLRYVGASPSNYVRYNNELWRIIGVMNNIQTEGGQSQSLLKIRRAESLGSYVWDSSEQNVNKGYGINQWGASTYENGDPYEGADLMRELNTDYLGNYTIITNSYYGWFSGNKNYRARTVQLDTISSDAQNMIESVVWNLGSPNNDNGTYIDKINDPLIAPFIYMHERANTNGKLCSSRDQCNDTVVRTSTWTGKVALFYPSDYLYATSGGSTSNRQTCLNTKMANWSKAIGSDCNANDWLGSVTTYLDLTLSPMATSFASSYVFTLPPKDAYVINIDRGNVHPTLYLKSAVSITGGTGTEQDPYTLSL